VTVETNWDTAPGSTPSLMSPSRGRQLRAGLWGAGPEPLCQPERNGAPLPHGGAPFNCGLRAWHSTTANASVFPACLPAKPLGLLWLTGEPATLGQAGVDPGEPSGSRNQQAKIPSAPASPAGCKLAHASAAQESVEEMRRSPA
jgi:hypothetical protein